MRKSDIKYNKPKVKKIPKPQKPQKVVKRK